MCSGGGSAEGDCGEWGSEPGGAGDREEGHADAAKAGGSVVNRKRGLLVLVTVAQGKVGELWAVGGQVSSSPPRGMPCGSSSAARSEIDGTLG